MGGGLELNKLQSKKDINRLALLFSVTYMVSYITRINFATVISEIGAATNIPKSLLSIPLTGSFITYGAGQIVSGICGDKFSAKKLVSCGLLVTTLMNFLIPLCKDHIRMFFVWSINGFAQAFMWPPLVKIMASLLTVDDYKKTIVKMSWGSSVGTIFMYLFSPLVISHLGFRAVFIISAACGVVMLLFWNAFAIDTGASMSCSRPENGAEKTRLNLFNPIMLGVMAAVIFQGVLKEGVATWMPSYVAETYRLSNAVSILTGVVLPIFGMVCFWMASLLYGKRFKNPISCASVFFLIAMFGAFLLMLSSGKNAEVSILCSAVLTGSMSGVNLMLISMIPQFFSECGKVSTVSGILNSCAYMGSALSTYVVALLAERFGWEFNLLVYLATASLGTVICALLIGPWKRKYMEKTPRG